MNCMVRLITVCLCAHAFTNCEDAYGQLRNPDEKWAEVFLLCEDLASVVQLEESIREKSGEIETLKLRAELIRQVIDPNIALPGKGVQFGHVHLHELAFKRAPDLESAIRYRKMVLDCERSSTQIKLAAINKVCGMAVVEDAEQRSNDLLAWAKEKHSLIQVAQRKNTAMSQNLRSLMDRAAKSGKVDADAIFRANLTLSHLQGELAAYTLVNAIVAHNKLPTAEAQINLLKSHDLGRINFMKELAEIDRKSQMLTQPADLLAASLPQLTERLDEIETRILPALIAEEKELKSGLKAMMYEHAVRRHIFDRITTAIPNAFLSSGTFKTAHGDVEVKAVSLRHPLPVLSTPDFTYSITWLPKGPDTSLIFPSHSVPVKDRQVAIAMGDGGDIAVYCGAGQLGIRPKTRIDDFRVQFREFLCVKDFLMNEVDWKPLEELPNKLPERPVH